MSPLHLASQQGHLGVATFLCQLRADLEAQASDELRPLHLACLHDQDEVVSMLIGAKATPDALCYSGMTPMYIAAAKGFADVVRHLCTAAADPDRAELGCALPLEKTAFEGWRQLGRHLCVREDRQGATPLYIAARNGYADIVRCLCAAGADAKRPTDASVTPLQIAAQSGHATVVNVLCDLAVHVNHHVLQDCSHCEISRWGHDDIADAVVDLIPEIDEEAHGCG